MKSIQKEEKMSNENSVVYKGDVLVSIKRTLVPIIVGAVAGTILGQWVDINTIENFVGSIISGVYYTVVRFIEAKHPAIGILLGSKKQPIYVDVEVVKEDS